jgi:hypothetical protein
MWGHQAASWGVCTEKSVNCNTVEPFQVNALAELEKIYP